ncbi:MAG: hypothetical protein ABIP74_04045 [Candidatus Saccharimonas sp.]
MSETFKDQIADMPDGVRAAYEQALTTFAVTIEELSSVRRGSEKVRAELAIQRMLAGAAFIAYNIGLRDGSVSQPHWVPYKESSTNGSSEVDDVVESVEFVDPIIDATYRLMEKPLPPLDSKEYRDLKEHVDMRREEIVTRLGYVYGMPVDGGK